MVLLIVNYDGQWEDGQFNPKDVFFLSVTVKETLKTLAEKICRRLGLNCDEVDFKISTRIDGSIVEMIYDLDLQIFVSHNKENPKCYVSVFDKHLRSQVEQLTLPPDLKSKSTTGDLAGTPPPMMKCKSTLSPVVTSSGYRSTTGSNECVPVHESNTLPSIRKSIFPQSPLDRAGKKSGNDSNDGGVNLVIHPLYSSGVLSGPEHELKLCRRSGRQRKSIKKYNHETCSNCSEKGHNKSGCQKPAFDASRPTKPPRTCSICHRPGHNRQTCPSGE